MNLKFPNMIFHGISAVTEPFLQHSSRLSQAPPYPFFHSSQDVIRNCMSEPPCLGLVRLCRGGLSAIFGQMPVKQSHPSLTTVINWLFFLSRIKLLAVLMLWHLKVGCYIDRQTHLCRSRVLVLYSLLLHISVAVVLNGPMYQVCIIVFVG